MSLKHLDSQIEDLGTQAASIQKRGARTRDIVNSDRTLSDVGKREKLDEAAADRTAWIATTGSLTLSTIPARLILFKYQTS